MPRRFKGLLLAFAVVVGLLTFSNASAHAESKIASLDLSQKLVGKFDLTSSERTTVIVELEEKSIVEAKHLGVNQSKQKLDNARQVVADTVTQWVPDAEVKQEYDYLFSGFALELAGTDIARLATVPGVKAVYPNVRYQVNAQVQAVGVENKPSMVNSNPYVGGVAAWMLGFTGEGIKVAVIDDGVDYTHPELEHAFGEYKGYDFYDMDNDPQEGPGDYHGTHVAGTIAAWSFGIAYDAQLLAYRVLGPDGGSSQQVIAGIEQAVKDGADVMNLSLGNILNDPDYATSIALDWAMAEGVVAVTSNGNEGPDAWTVGSPGASRHAISVGSTALPQTIFVGASLYTSEGVSYPSAKMMGSDSAASANAINGQTYEFVHVGFGSPEEFANVDVEGKVALIQRGAGIAFTDKNYEAMAHGAVAAIIYNNVPNEEISAGGTWYLPVVQLTLEDGEKMLDELALGNNQVTINVTGVDLGETISDFSSRGPAYGTWMIKPDISAPGDSIYSTIPLELGGYGYAGGTSMASPHVAAAAALVLQAHPEYTPQQVKAVLMNTAEPFIDPATGEPYPHNVQGAGSLRIVEAIQAETIVNPGSYSFGTFMKTKGKQVEGQHIEIQNLSDTRKTYTFDVEFFGNPRGIKVSTSNNLKVNAGATQQVKLNVQVDASKLEPGYYEGVITVSDGTEEIKVPTILFIQEPDYPRVAFAGVDYYGPGDLVAYSYHPGGADYAELAIYSFNAQDGTIGQWLGWYAAAENVAPGFFEAEWDGTAFGTIPLPKGEYVIIAYAEYKGQTDAKAFLFEIPE